MTVAVEVAGRSAEGRGSVYLSDQWAWPDQAIPHSDRDRAMRDLTLALADRLPELLPEPAHPLELGLRLAAAALPDFRALGPLDPPLLARVVCSSPFDAAIHDGVGMAVGRSAFELYDEAVLPAADLFFPDRGARRPILEMLSSHPRRTLDAWWVVGADDAPDDLGAAVARSGYRSFKLKVRGLPIDDVAFVANVHAAAVAANVAQPVISVDYNGACRTPEPVIEFLDRLARDQPAAYARALVHRTTGPGGADRVPRRLARRRAAQTGARRRRPDLGGRAADNRGPGLVGGGPEDRKGPQSLRDLGGVGAGAQPQPGVPGPDQSGHCRNPYRAVRRPPFDAERGRDQLAPVHAGSEPRVAAQAERVVRAPRAESMSSPAAGCRALARPPDAIDNREDRNHSQRQAWTTTSRSTSPGTSTPAPRS